MVRPRPGDPGAQPFGRDEEEPAPKPLPWKELRQRLGHGQGGKRDLNRWRTYPKEVSPIKLDKKLLNTFSLEGLLEEMEGGIDKWPARCIATAWHRLAKLTHPDAGPRAHDAVRRLARALERLPPGELRPRDLGKIIYSFGVLKFQRAKLVNALLDDAVSQLGEFDSRGLANTMYGLGVLNVRHERFLNAVGEQAPARLAEFEVQEIVNTVYSMARLDFRHKEFLGAVCREVPSRFRECNAQELSNLIYAMWLLRFRHRFFLTELCQHLPGRLQEFNPQNLANTVYALGKLKFKDPVFVKAVSYHMGTRVTELNRAKVIQNILRSLGTLQS